MHSCLKENSVSKSSLFPTKFYVSFTVNCRMAIGFFSLFLNQYQIKPSKWNCQGNNIVFSRKTLYSTKESVTSIFKLNLEKKVAFHNKASGVFRKGLVFETLPSLASEACVCSLDLRHYVLVQKDNRKFKPQNNLQGKYESSFCMVECLGLESA